MMTRKERWKEQQQMERRAVADAAYEAWRSGRNYDHAWDRAEQAVHQTECYDRYEAEEAAMHGAFRK